VFNSIAGQNNQTSSLESQTTDNVGLKNHTTPVLGITLAKVGQFSFFSLPDSARNLQ